MFIYSLKASTIRFFRDRLRCACRADRTGRLCPDLRRRKRNADAPAAHLPEETSAPGGQTPGGAGERDLSVRQGAIRR